MKDNSWSRIILEDIYNTFYKDEAEAGEEAEHAKESEDMTLSIMKEKFLSMVESDKGKVVSDDLFMIESDKGKEKLMVSDEMVDYVLEKYGNKWKCEDEIADVILEDLRIKYEKG
ncbi:hypothetical protein Tco_0979540 [Tanacetum coccineum]